MSCVSGVSHTITLSDDGVVYSFGQSINEVELCSGHNTKVSTPIPYLPQIKQIACGGRFAVCVDFEGFLWSFGENKQGQLGTGNTTSVNVPQKNLNVPPVFSVSCGHDSTFIITNDSYLWSCGKNNFGQLCLGNKENQSNFQQTTFFNITKVSCGYCHTLFQMENQEIYSCGSNILGELGLGYFCNIKLTPNLIPELPQNIIQFVCGDRHNIFLDSEGNVFSVGHNFYGQLGLGHNISQKIVMNISNIPPIQSISCVNSSCYLLDIEGNVWSFGYNSKGQLGHGDTNNRNAPTKIESLKDIQQISYGYGSHFLAKDSQNKIFATGSNTHGQLGTGDTNHIQFPKK